MASRRVVVIVALCAAAAVVAIVGGTVLLSRHESTTPADARPGKPVLELEVAPTTPLGRAAHLLDTGHAAAAAAIFRRYSNPVAELGLAFAQWTGPSSLAKAQEIANGARDDPAVVLNLGWADFWAGQRADAANAWQQTARRFPDSPYAIAALDDLHPAVNRGLPYIVVDQANVPAKARPALAAGIDFWDRLMVVSARRELDAAAKLAPNSPETLVAAAVAQFSPADPKAPFPLLGPLSGRFPHDSIVRLHLGVVLLWSAQEKLGKAQLRLAAAEQPTSIYARTARRILQALGQK